MIDYQVKKVLIVNRIGKRNSKDSVCSFCSNLIDYDNFYILSRNNFGKIFLHNQEYSRICKKCFDEYFNVKIDQYKGLVKIDSSCLICDKQKEQLFCLADYKNQQHNIYCSSCFFNACDHIIYISEDKNFRILKLKENV